jgi:hypothetical protein
MKWAQKKDKQTDGWCDFNMRPLGGIKMFPLIGVVSPQMTNVKTNQSYYLEKP